jgi:hypothetical protein
MKTNEGFFCTSAYSRQYSKNEIGHVTGEVWNREMYKK